jgi:signal transduction histidine kinase/CheY-like chemotaxis protein
VLFISTVLPLGFGFNYLATYVSDQHKESVQESLEAITQIAKNRILASVKRINDNTALVASRTQLRRSLLALQQTDNADLAEQELGRINRIISDAASSISDLKEISIFDNNKRIVASTIGLSEQHILPGTTWPHVNLTQDSGVTVLNGYARLILDEQAIGYIKLSVKPKFIEEIIQQGDALGETGEWLLAARDAEGNAVFVAPTRYENAGAFNRVLSQEATQVPMTQALAGKDLVMWDAIDYAGNRVVASTRFIPEYNWGMVAKIHSEEVFEQVNDIIFRFILVLLVVFVMILIIGIVLSNFIAKPIESLTKQTLNFKQQPEPKLEVYSTWREAKLLTKSFNEMLLDINKLNTDLNDKVVERTSELAAANNKLLAEKLKAENATKAKSSFLANMSHELRTPLNSIHGSLQLLARRKLDEKSNRLVETAGFSMQSLLAIINNILDLSKIESDAIELECAYFEFRELVEQVIIEMDVLASKKGILLSYEVSPSFIDGWMGDALRIKQILVNFISNAIKFTDSGKVTILLGKESKDPAAALYFSVTDTGCGMDEDFVTQIFDRFTQADSSTTRKFGGTGLGMPISLGLVRAMGGTIDVMSKPSEGTRIHTSLPIEHVAKRNTYQQDADIGTTPNLKGKTVLLAEDNEINRVIFASMLEETNATLVMAEDGKEAVALFKEVKPDITFLDINMPVMDGEEACKEILSMSSDALLVSLTANIAPEDIERYDNLGFKHHIGKPIVLASLYRVLSLI